MNRLCYITVLLVSWLCFGGVSLPLYADDDFNPLSPDDPAAIDYCKVTVATDQPEGSYVSGGGRYVVGSGSIWISTSANNTPEYTYEFKYWTQNGQQTSYPQDFSFTPQKGTFNFVAHYEKKEVVFDPDSPDDPSASTIKKKYYLYLTSNITECSFNIASGEKHEEGDYISLSPNYDSNKYSFVGWKNGDVTVSTSSYYYFAMPSAETTLKAMFEEIPFDPESPSDPSASSDTHEVTRKFVNVSIGNSSTTTVDKTRIVFNETKTTGYDTGTDNAKTLSSSASYQIYSIGDDGTKYSVNERPVSDGIIPLGIVVNQAGAVVITATRADCTIDLYDKLLGKSCRLSNVPYTFQSEAGTFNDRFELQVPSGYILGDANGDGEVNVADITAVVSYIFGQTPANFNATAADVNGSGEINVADITGIVSIIYGGNNQ